jgi:hypothetical protein
VQAVLAFEAYVILAVSLLALGVKGFALVNALLWSAEAYSTAQKLTKPAWVAMLGFGVLFELLFMVQPVNPLNLAASVAALVYLFDVRPAIAELNRR